MTDDGARAIERARRERRRRRAGEDDDGGESGKRADAAAGQGERSRAHGVSERAG